MLSKRIKEVRKALNLTQEEFAKKMLATRPMIASYEINKVVPNELFLERICKEFNVNMDWLKNGVGEMFLSTDKDEEFYKFVAELTLNERPELKETMLEIANLSEEQMTLLLGMLKEFKKSRLK